MGLLEKAGKIKDDDKPKKAAAKAKTVKAKPVKAAKAKPVKKAKPAREPREKKAREPRVMPDNFKLAGKAGIFARKSKIAYTSASLRAWSLPDFAATIRSHPVDSGRA